MTSFSSPTSLFPSLQLIPDTEIHLSDQYSNKIFIELCKRLKYGDLTENYQNDVQNGDKFEQVALKSAMNVICGNIDTDCALAINSLSNLYAPSDYTFAENFWGNSFYKIYTESLNYGDAKAQCESDGAFLAYPRSEAENEFLVSLMTTDGIWIGINDIDEEGLFVGVDGREISWTKWADDEPNNWLNNEDGVALWSSGEWRDVGHDSWSGPFICSINIEGKIFVDIK